MKGFEMPKYILIAIHIHDRIWKFFRKFDDTWWLTNVKAYLQIKRIAIDMQTCRFWSFHFSLRWLIYYIVTYFVTFIGYLRIWELIFPRNELLTLLKHLSIQNSVFNSKAFWISKVLIWKLFYFMKSHFTDSLNDTAKV